MFFFSNTFGYLLLKLMSSFQVEATELLDFLKHENNAMLLLKNTLDRNNTYQLRFLVMALHFQI